jgi:hypothetical protein
MVEWRYGSTFLDLGNRWRCMVSFTLLLLYPQFPLDRRMGGPQSRFGFGKILHCLELNLGHPMDLLRIIAYRPHNLTQIFKNQ